jgi:hypothetical protein
LIALASFIGKASLFFRMRGMTCILGELSAYLSGDLLPRMHGRRTQDRPYYLATFAPSASALLDMGGYPGERRAIVESTAIDDGFDPLCILDTL